MAELFSLQVVISGFTGGPGLNTWHFTSGDITTGQSHIEEAATELREFYNAMRAYCLTTQTFSFTGESRVSDIATGAIQQQIAYNVPAPVTGQDASGKNSKATQAKIRLYTDTVVGRRLLRGGIYFGPLSDEGLNTDGSIVAGLRTAAQNGLAALINAPGPRLQVWHRPKGQPLSGGVAGDVVGVNVMPVPAVLRSRRD